MCFKTRKKKSSNYQNSLKSLLQLRTHNQVLPFTKDQRYSQKHNHNYSCSKHRCEVPGTGTEGERAKGGSVWTVNAEQKLKGMG